MQVNAATFSESNSHAAYSRLAAARAQLITDQIPTAAHSKVITADRAAVADAEAEVVRIEAEVSRAGAMQAGENASFLRSGRFMDVYA
ncbi:hypothetical protein [Actinoplanes derwentensis]|uniref:Uncharacterized protein n=1 Tax=Actinoplanes derwentensis TaxID=113562 RepID=A0A1H2AMZ5_9ACTN|nr:hypothetical protein [Actinoplanes derwentensis]GID89284.1 hypothetical protein Ade03nite_82080 [Actinoplanes derwentensis]SDT47224.1 hypothetical protein SAMN04489716_3964 [Actinoplanes derwentensis]